MKRKNEIGNWYWWAAISILPLLFLMSSCGQSGSSGSIPSAAMASSDRPTGPAIPYGIKGVYAVTGLSTCGTGPGIMEANYTFNLDGTVSVKGFSRNISPPAPFDFMEQQADFHYTVTQEGRIEFQYPDGGFKLGYTDSNGVFVTIMQVSGGPSHGVISPDGKMITITCGPPVVLHPMGSTDEMKCVTSLMGMLIHPKNQ